MLNESQKTNAQIRQRKKCTQTHFFCAFVQNLQWEEIQYAKNIRDGKMCAKNGMEIAAHKTYLVYAAFWCSENCAAKCWKQKWHKSGAARLGSGFCAIYVVIYLRQYRIILSADTASEVRQMPPPVAETANRSRGRWSQSARAFAPKHDAGTATRHYRAFWQRRCRAAAAGAVLKPQGGNCAVLPYIKGRNTD